MSGSTETQFTAIGPATIGFQTQPPETNTQFEIGVDVSGFSLGIKGTGTGGERSPPRPGSGGTGVQGNGSGVGWGVAGFGGNATPGTIGADPTACAGVLGNGGIGPQSGGPGVAGIGGVNSGVGVLGQGGVPGNAGEPGGPGVKGIGGASSAQDFADGVQGFGAGTFSGVAGLGGASSGTGVFGAGGKPAGPGVRGIGAGGPNTVPHNPDGSAQAAGVYGQGGAQSPGVVGQGGVSGDAGQAGGPGVKGIGGASSAQDFADGVQGFGAGTFSGVAGFGGPSSGTGAVGFGGGPAGPGIRGIGAGGPNTVPHNPDGTAQAAGVYGQGGAQSPGVVGQGGSESGPGVVGFGSTSQGVGVWGILGGAATTGPTRPAGVFGQSSGGVVGSVGVQGMGAFGVHGVTRGIAGDTAVFAEGPLNGIGIFASGGQAGFFGGDVDIFGASLFVTGNVSVSGNLSVLGSKSALVPFPDGSHRQLYCMESPESWFEDFGFGHLIDGQASILLDRNFATAINTDGYHVFITEYDDDNGLFVTNRTTTGFEVRAKTSASSASFSYRVVARRKDITPSRFAEVTISGRSLDEIKARLAQPAAAR